MAMGLELELELELEFEMGLDIFDCILKFKFYYNIKSD